MLNTTNPFMNMDMTKVMADFDPAKIADQFTKMAGAYKVPQFDVDSIMNAQRKNIDAMTAANKAAVEGVQALAARQNEIFQETLAGATEAVSQLTTVAGPEDAAAKQAELLKVSFEKALGNMKELAELAAKSNADASEVINARISESFDEVKKQAAKTKKPTK